ncbi:SCAN domain-containing protein 3 [Eumeta japonica]|uniref:SCAN domain-containing protein 3 n=1 Tax=Eumeta variegata TaxID=151549 RepID=A0A4C1WM17_EUMVA|nr:SCAN domain-containing protein 3 [Eumeta japonica]
MGEEIHEEHLFAKTLKTDTKVKKIRSNALNMRLFAQLCDENDEDLQRLLLHTEVRWLSKDVECLDEDIQTYVQHLIALHDDFKVKFEDILSMEIPPWIINPFDETEVENVILQEELLELSTNEELKVTFKRGYQKFWLQAEIPEKYRGLWGTVQKLLIAFPSSYLVEKSFRAVTNLLTKKGAD